MYWFHHNSSLLIMSMLNVVIKNRLNPRLEDKYFFRIIFLLKCIDSVDDVANVFLFLAYKIGIRMFLS